MRILRWALGEAWEKINIPATFREIKALGKKYGARFFWAALIWELIEDVLFPFLSWKFGMPELIPLFLIFHFEPIVYPVFFWAFRMWGRVHGNEPWNPSRSAHSIYWRSLAKVLIYKMAATGWFVAIMITLQLSLKIIIAYVILTLMFGFVHERIWHDSNYGIKEDDRVMMRRNFVKATTYRFLSIMIMYPLFRAIIGNVPWKALFLCQAIGLIIYIGLEILWASSVWGIEENSIPEKGK